MSFHGLKVGCVNWKENLFLCLFEECKCKYPRATLSYQLSNKLEKLPRNVRREISSFSKEGCTPLFMASKKGHVKEVVELLLENGAHLDLPNHIGETPKSLLIQNQREFRLIKYVSLKCLAATAVVHYNIPYSGSVPATLETLLKFHKPYARRITTRQISKSTR